MLVVLADGPLATFSSWVYAAALVAMFGASALYHRFPWKSTARRLWARRWTIDDLRLHRGLVHAVRAPVFRGSDAVARAGDGLSGAALGLFLELIWIESPRWLSAGAYITVGWVGILAIPQMFSGVGVAGAVLLLVGGAIYTVGAAIYAFQWPNPFPRTFGFHEIFHLLVVAAAVTQFVAVSLVVM